MIGIAKAALTIGTSATAIAAGAAVALTNGGAVSLSTTGVSFVGRYGFYPEGTNHGGMAYPGKICDTSADGNPVFVHARVEGYGYGISTYERRGNTYCTVENAYVYDRDTPYVNSGQIQACQDRGIWSDLCSTSPKYKR